MKEKIIHGSMSLLERIDEIERICFSKEDAADKDALKQRLLHFPECFWVYEINGEAVAFVEGMTSQIKDLKDDMYHDASMHDPLGDWQMIFGVATLPEYQGRGYAGKLIKKAIEDSFERGKNGIVLTCKEHMIGYYSRFGFVNEGKSESSHGGAIWYQMRYEYE